MAPGDVSLRRLVVPIYGPTALASVGVGAAVPLIALTARDLGAGVGLAAIMVGLMGVGQLIGDLPAGALAQRFGEKKALVTAGIVEAGAFLVASLAQNLLVLALAITVAGMGSAVFGLARHAYLTGAVPTRHRAKALSALGGSFRAGTFVGPFIAAAMLQVLPIMAVYGLAAVMSLLAALLALQLPDLETSGGTQPLEGVRPPSMWQVLHRHRRVLIQLGSGIVAIAAVRSARQSIVPLWCEHIGLDASMTSIVYGISAAVDMAMFLPGGAMVDRLGRVWGAVPPLIVLGLGFVLLPLSHDLASVIAVGIVLGLGNGFSAGIVMTLGADNAPQEGRAQFLGGWRLCGDVGNAIGPGIISLITLVASLGVASVAIGVLGWIGSTWLARSIPRFNSPLGTRHQRKGVERKGLE